MWEELIDELLEEEGELVRELPEDESMLESADMTEAANSLKLKGFAPFGVLSRMAESSSSSM